MAGPYGQSSTVQPDIVALPVDTPVTAPEEALTLATDGALDVNVPADHALPGVDALADAPTLASVGLSDTLADGRNAATQGHCVAFGPIGFAVIKVL